MQIKKYTLIFSFLISISFLFYYTFEFSHGKVSYFNAIEINQHDNAIEVNQRNKGPYRGLSILGLLNKRFPVKKAFNILKHSKTPSFQFLYGAFGRKPKNYYEIISYFLDKEITPHVQIYTICGPCRAPRRIRLNITKFCKRKTIDELNRALVQNRRVKRRYKRWVLKIRRKFVDPYPELNFTIVPELEDNLTDRSFKVTLKILRKVFKGYKNVKYARNINGIGRYKGLPMEVHSTNKYILNLVGKGDIVSFDGSRFNFPGENFNAPSYESIKQLIRKAYKKGVHVYVWRFEFQGLDENNPKHPNDRTYRFIRVHKLKELMSL